MALYHKRGSTQTCQTCGEPLELTDGTDPDKIDRVNEWEEIYQCPNGHTGTYRFDKETGKERFAGCTKKSRQQRGLTHDFYAEL